MMKKDSKTTDPANLAVTLPQGITSVASAASPVTSDTDDMPPELALQSMQASLSRRDFVKLSGLAALGAIAASCSGPERHVVPRLRPAEHVTPGVAYHYASTCSACSSHCGTLVKVRDGRPIKMEGNPHHPMTADPAGGSGTGGLCAKGQASVLGLYDPDRLRHPTAGNHKTTWADVDTTTLAALKAASSGAIRILSGTVNSPSTRAVIEEFLAKYRGAKHVMYDAISTSAIADAHEISHGQRITPRYVLDKARVIVSFGADFLGTWISPVEFSAAWARRRTYVGGNTSMTRHVQVEAVMSVTGANADERWRVADSKRGAVLVALAKRVAARLAVADPFAAPGEVAVKDEKIEALAGELVAARGNALVLCGSNDVNQQLVVNFINNALAAYGSCIDLRGYSRQNLGDDRMLAELVKDMEAGKVQVLILYGVNPVYNLPDGEKFKEALKKVKTTIAISDRADETASECTVVAPDHHPLETWNDFEPHAGLRSIAQPMIHPLHETREAQLSLLAWCESSRANRPWRELVKEHWVANNLMRGQSWEVTVENGYFDARGAIGSPALTGSIGAEVGKAAAGTVVSGTGAFELVAYESVAMGDGSHANNAWLQELPDPLTKITWDNFAAFSAEGMRKLGLSNGDEVRIDGERNGLKISMLLPAVKLPGMDDGSVAVAVGYGRLKAGMLARGDYHAPKLVTIGANVFPLVAANAVIKVQVSRTGEKLKLAMTQIHDAQEGRPLALQTTKTVFDADPRAAVPEPRDNPSMWPKVEHPVHRWGMSVNLNTCTGCSACVIACNAENNIPVVGKQEVYLRREMHWLRIDRYFSDDKPDQQYQVSDDPSVVFQPMMCQQCTHAPCETVCPVNATSHTEEGLNAQTYNRCVGTRYCANNCPYKVRRFNWFNYPHNRDGDELLNLVLNPDVTIRSRGVMEKCSMCVQRISAGKLKARLEGRPVADGEIKMACEQSCPTQALVFGDFNDPNSRVAKLRQEQRSYRVLDELNVEPGIHYLAQVRNTTT